MARTFTGSTSGIQIAGNSIPISTEYTTFGIFYATSIPTTSYVLSGGGDYHGLRLTATTMTYRYGGGNTATPTSNQAISLNTWYFVAVTKATGTVAHRFHIYNYSTNTWTHINETATTNQSSAAVTDMWIGRWYSDTDFSFNGDIAVAGHANKNLSDDQVQGMAFSLAAIEAVGPLALYVLDQSAITQAVRNVFDGGQQSTITGTSVATRSVPSFSYGHPILESSNYASGVTQSDSSTGSVTLDSSTVAGVLRPGTGSSAVTLSSSSTSYVERPGSGSSTVTLGSSTTSGLARVDAPTSAITLSSSTTAGVLRPSTGTGSTSISSSTDVASLRPGTGTGSITLSSSTAGAATKPGTGSGSITLSSSTVAGVLRPGDGTGTVTLTGTAFQSGEQLGSGTSGVTLGSSTQSSVLRPGAGTGTVTLGSNSSALATRPTTGSSGVTLGSSTVAGRVVTGSGSSSVTLTGQADGAGAQTGTGTGTVTLGSTVTQVVLRPATGSSPTTLDSSTVANVVPAATIAGEGTSAVNLGSSTSAVRATPANTSSSIDLTSTSTAEKVVVGDGSSDIELDSSTDQGQILDSPCVGVFELDSETLGKVIHVATGSGAIHLNGLNTGRVIKAVLLQYPDVEAKMAAALEQFVVAGRVGTETPADLAQKLPFIRVTRRGGSDNGVTDRARIDVEVFAATRAIGYPLIEKIRQHLIQTSAYRADDPFDVVRCDVGPQELPWGDGRTVRRWTTSYSVSSRRARY
jgi:hypothetical protein